MLAHCTSQGALTAAQGGKFQHGFFAGAFSAGSEKFTSKNNSKAGKVLASSVVGGTASVLGGGKFANGAVTGAYVMLFNYMMHPDKNDIESRKAKVDFRKATGQEKMDQLLYAFDYEFMVFMETGNYSQIDLDNYFTNLPNYRVAAEGEYIFTGNAYVNGEAILVTADIKPVKGTREPFMGQWGFSPDIAPYTKTYMHFFPYRPVGHKALPLSQLLLSVPTDKYKMFEKRYHLQ